MCHSTNDKINALSLRQEEDEPSGGCDVPCTVPSPHFLTHIATGATATILLVYKAEPVPLAFLLSTKCIALFYGNSSATIQRLRGQIRFTYVSKLVS